jgi:ubiquitin-protein ligase
MSAFDERRQQDVQKLRDLQRASESKVLVTRLSGTPPNEIEVELRFRTAPSQDYPRKVQDITRAVISLPARYPFAEPSVSIKTPILHPNVYASGRICLGVKWISSFGLDLLVRRIIQIITFDPSVLNDASPANREAAVWYRNALRKHPTSFPSDSFELTAAPAQPPKTMRWASVEAPTKVLVPCPACKTKLSLPSGKLGRVRCPECGNAFEAET